MRLGHRRTVFSRRCRCHHLGDRKTRHKVRVSMRIELDKWLEGRGGTVYQQANFVRDNLLPLVGHGLDWEDYARGCFVIGEHTSKQIILPVYEMCREDLGLRLVMRNNFHDKRGVRDGLALAAELVESDPCSHNHPKVIRAAAERIK